MDGTHGRRGEAARGRIGRPGGGGPDHLPGSQLSKISTPPSGWFPEWIEAPWSVRTARRKRLGSGPTTPPRRFCRLIRTKRSRSRVGPARSGSLIIDVQPASRRSRHSAGRLRRMSRLFFDPRVDLLDPRVQLSDPRVNNLDPRVRRLDPLRGRPAQGGGAPAQTRGGLAQARGGPAQTRWNRGKE
jgi:hypothetical protein